jgi:hypothetical protein
MNPAPDADLHSVGQANFEWIIREVADLAIARASHAPAPPSELRWATFLSGTLAHTPAKKGVAKKAPAAKPAARKSKKTEASSSIESAG